MPELTHISKIIPQVLPPAWKHRIPHEVAWRRCRACNDRDGVKCLPKKRPISEVLDTECAYRAIAGKVVMDTEEVSEA